MNCFTTLVLLALSSTSAFGEPVKLNLHDSTLVPTDGAIHEMLIQNPSIVNVVPLNSNQFHIQAVGTGITTVTANLEDGQARTFEIEVSKKRLSGKADFEFIRGRGLMLHLPSSATYVGVGDPNLVNITHLEGHQRYFLVGLNDGKTNLIVINENGLQKSVIQVGKKIDDSTRTHISLVDSSSVLQVLDRRPTNLVVANKQIASAKLQRTKDGKYGVTITGHSPGDTDILLSLGLEHRPVWYTVHVETE